MKPYRALHLNILRASGLSDKKLEVLFTECIRAFREDERTSRIVVSSSGQEPGYTLTAWDTHGNVVVVRRILIRAEGARVKVFDRRVLAPRAAEDAAGQ